MCLDSLFFERLRERRLRSVADLVGVLLGLLRLSGEGVLLDSLAVAAWLPLLLGFGEPGPASVERSSEDVLLCSLTMAL